MNMTVKQREHSSPFMASQCALLYITLCQTTRFKRAKCSLATMADQEHLFQMPCTCTETEAYAKQTSLTVS